MKDRRSAVRNPRSAFSWDLRTKIIVWAFVPTAIVLGAVALVNFYAYQQVTEEAVIQRDRELTRLSAGQLATELTEYTDLLTTLARAASAFPGEPLAQRDILSRASSRLAVFDAGTLILDTFGRVVATEPERPEILGQDWSDRSTYRQILRSQIAGLPQPMFSDVVSDGPDGAEVVVAAVPIVGEQGELLGAVAGMFRLGSTSVSAFYGDIVKLRIAEGGTTYLVDGSGRVIYHSDADRIGADFSAQAAVERVLSGQTDALRTLDFAGQDIVAGFAPVPGTPWGLVTEELWAVLTSRSRGYQWFLLLLLGIGVAVPALVVTVGVRRITEPVKELITAAQEVARGDFGRTIAARTGDEVEELAEQFNRMSAQLQESYSHLEQRVADRTRELAALNAIAGVVSRSLDLEEVLDSALGKTLEVTGIEAGGIYLLQQDDQILSIAAHSGLSPAFVAAVDHLEVGEGFSGRVVRTGEPMVVSDLSWDARLSRPEVLESGFRSTAVFPLVSRGSVLGSMFVITCEPREFSQQDIELMTSIGGQIGAAVGNARLFGQAEQRTQELEALYRADEELYHHIRLDEVLQTLSDVAVDILGADKSALLVWDAQRQRLVVRASRGFSPATRARMVFALGEGVVGRVAASGAPMIVEDAQADLRVARRITEAAGIRSFMHVPITIGGEVFGVFNVSFTQPRAFGDQEQRLFIALAQRAALVVENAQLYERAQEMAVVEERSRLARDLHDAVTQTLFSATLIADVLPRLWERDPEVALGRLEEVRQLTRGALAEMRTLLLELRPSALVEAELSELLRQLAEATTGRARVPVTVEVMGACDVPPEVKVALYRVAQEALNNVAKHAGASQATVSLRCTSLPSEKLPTDSGSGLNGLRSVGPRGTPLLSGGEGESESRDALSGMGVELAIRDDGRGFDPRNVAPNSLGLGIMRERMEAIGAGLMITSEMDQGTEVVVLWPGPDGGGRANNEGRMTEVE
jgi:nitrate/nitrite-specific signal transduction histidine kinase